MLYSRSLVRVDHFLRSLDLRDPELAARIRKAELPADALAAYAVAYHGAEGVRILKEAVGDFGYEGSRGETILEVGHEDLRAMGITSGRWWDGAPWRLVNLPVQELAYEGTRQRHCVGRFDMGYREAVERGEREVWSLRSVFDSPVLTFDVDASEWNAATTPVHAGIAIEHVGGKLNRDAGADPEEAKVLYFVCAALEVDPEFVGDFVDARRRRTPIGFDVPWVPYHLRKRPVGWPRPIEQIAEASGTIARVTATDLDSRFVPAIREALILAIRENSELSLADLVGFKDQFLAPIVLTIRVSELIAGAAASNARRPRTNGRPKASARAASTSTSGRRRSKSDDGPLAGRILDLLKDASGPMRSDQLRKVLGGTAAELRRVLDKLRADGKIKRRGKRRGTSYELR